MKIAGMLTLLTLFVALAVIVIMYYVTGGEMPTKGDITLAGAVSILLVFGCHSLWRRRKPSVDADKPLLWACILAASLSGCMRPLPAPPPPPPPPPPPASANGHGAVETARKFLYAGLPEDTAYGLTSYLLFSGEPATDTQRARYHKAIEAYLRTVSATEAARHFAKNEINVFYLPLKQRTMENVDSILKYYDYARARAMLIRLPGEQEAGPYLVSSSVALSSVTPRRYLLQDLTLAHPRLIDTWIREFRVKALQPRFWAGSDNGQNFVMHMRNVLAVASEVTPAVRDSIADLIKWIES
jgi:hypothetical protein